mmetsp:Transcript_8833/g.10113  ORF Transcript_8833/g.10113 Transcript_8833/m.10113 type:complete len:96 (+) Transcript_8833:229-516(+)
MHRRETNKYTFHIQDSIFKATSTTTTNKRHHETSEFILYHDSMPRLCGGHSLVRAPTPEEVDFLTSTTVITKLLTPKLISSSSSSSSAFFLDSFV